MQKRKSWKLSDSALSSGDFRGECCTYNWEETRGMKMKANQHIYPEEVLKLIYSNRSLECTKEFKEWLEGPSYPKGQKAIY